MQVLTALCVLLCISSAFAVRSQWKQVDRADPQARIPIRFALTQRNLNVLESTLLDISNPRSANYGKWLTPAAVTEMVAPPKEVSKMVAEYLAASGASVEDRRDMVKMVAPVSLIEEMLQTTLFFFQHKTSNKVIIRAVGSYEIPSHIAEHVDFVAGLYEFPSINTNKKVAKADAQYDGFVVPYVINNLYNIPATFPVNPASSICLVEFQDDASYNKKDLKTFCAENNIVPEINVSTIVGPYSGSNPDAESTLDVQFGGAIAQNTSVWFWTVEDWMYDFATDFLVTNPFPLVVSMSWGWPEPQQCQVGNCTGDETSQQYVNRTNIEFQKIGAIGTSLLAASGDQGAPGDGNADCSGSGKKALSTIFPGASPWVLSVGATQLTNSTNATDDSAALPPICNKYSCATSTTELVCSFPAALITSGGGFSDYVPVPSYQAAAVNAYLKSGVTLPPSGDFNAKNRGFPDVSALGHNYLIDWLGGGGWTQVDGTSCSSPVVAAIVSLLNSYRLNNGKAPLGFVVPLFYEAWGSDNTIFNDITSGNNYCTESCCAKTGYVATKGWDPVTGLGTPNFEKLLNYVKTLP